jgi:hypothetical protein
MNYYMKRNCCHIRRICLFALLIITTKKYYNHRDDYAVPIGLHIFSYNKLDQTILNNKKERNTLICMTIKSVS